MQQATLIDIDEWDRRKAFNIKGLAVNEQYQSFLL